MNKLYIILLCLTPVLISSIASGTSNKLIVPKSASWEISDKEKFTVTVNEAGKLTSVKYFNKKGVHEVPKSDFKCIPEVDIRFVDFLGGIPSHEANRLIKISVAENECIATRYSECQTWIGFWFRPDSYISRSITVEGQTQKGKKYYRYFTKAVGSPEQPHGRRCDPYLPTPKDTSGRVVIEFGG